MLKDVEGYEGVYAVSKNGEVWAYPKQKTNKPNGRWLKIMKKHDGYYAVKFFDKLMLLHRVVAKTFIDNPDNKPEVNHKDGDKKNNKVQNLEWVTAKENTKKAWINGQHENTRKAHRENGKKRRKLTMEQARYIRTLNISCKSISEMYKVSPTVIQNIVKNKSYKE